MSDSLHKQILEHLRFCREMDDECFMEPATEIGDAIGAPYVLVLEALTELEKQGFVEQDADEEWMAVGETKIVWPEYTE